MQAFAEHPQVARHHEVMRDDVQHLAPTLYKIIKN